MSRIINNVKTLGIFAIMFALVATVIGAPAASASSLSTSSDATSIVTGHLAIKVEYNSPSLSDRQATVEFFNEYGQPVAKIMTDFNGEAKIELPANLYKMRVSSAGYMTVNQYIKVAPDAESDAQVTLVQNQFRTGLAVSR